MMHDFVRFVRFVLLGVLWSSLFSGYTRSELSPPQFSSLCPLFSCRQTPRTRKALKVGTPDGKLEPLVNLCLSWTKECPLPVFGTGDTPARRLLSPNPNTRMAFLDRVAQSHCSHAPILGWLVSAL